MTQGRWLGTILVNLYMCRKTDVKIVQKDDCLRWKKKGRAKIGKEQCKIIWNEKKTFLKIDVSFL